MANIRVDALTEVTTIADDDVVMIDGKQGVRATTWAALKNLIKQQCGINELNTKTTIRQLTEWIHIPAGNYAGGEKRYSYNGAIFREMIFVLQNGDAFEYVEVRSPFGKIPDSYFSISTTKGEMRVFIAASVGTIDLLKLPMDVRQILFRI